MPLVYTAAALRDLARPWTPDTLLSVDFETNGRPHHDPAGRIVSISLAPDLGEPEPTAYVIPFAMAGRNADVDVLPLVLETLAQHRNLLAWSLAMEAVWCAARWKLVAAWRHDPSIAARLLGWSTSALKSCAAVRLPGRPIIQLSALLGERHDFSVLDPDADLVRQYQEQDAIVPILLHRQAAPELRGPVRLAYALEVATAARMAQQQAVGYVVEPTRLQAQLRNEETRMQNLEQAIYRQLGARILLRSPAQVAGALAKVGLDSPLRTKGGRPSWSKEAIDLSIDAHPVLRDLSEWRQLDSLMQASKRYHETFAGGRIYPRWWTLGDNGYALPSSEGPAFHHLHTALRRSFLAPRDGEWRGLAWPRVAFRAVAALSTDDRAEALSGPEWPRFADAFRASYGLDPERMILRWLHLGEASAIAASSGLAVDRVHTILDDFTRKMPRLAAYLQDFEHLVDADLLGRHFVATGETPTERRSRCVQFVYTTTAATLVKSHLIRVPVRFGGLLPLPETLCFTAPQAADDDNGPPELPAWLSWEPVRLAGPSWGELHAVADPMTKV